MGSMALLAGARSAAGAPSAAARTSLARCWALNSATSTGTASRYPSPHSRPPSSVAAYSFYTHRDITSENTLSRQPTRTLAAPISRHPFPALPRVFKRHFKKNKYKREDYIVADDATLYFTGRPPLGLGRTEPRRKAEDEPEWDPPPDDPRRWDSPDEFLSERHLTQHPDMFSTIAERPQKEHRETIHILGGNNQATYLAHMLSWLPSNPAIHLVHIGFHQARRWDTEGNQVNIVRNHQVLPNNNNTVVGEYVGPAPRKRFVKSRERKFPQSFYTPLKPIEYLIVTMPCINSIRAFETIAHRINQRTTICLIQGGLGVVERLNELYFPDLPTRPTYLLAHMTHSLGYTGRSFTVDELEPGRLVFTRYTPLDQVEEEVNQEEVSPELTGDYDDDATAAEAAEEDGDFDAIVSDGEDGASSREPPPFVPELPPVQESFFSEFDNDGVLEVERNNGSRLMYLLGVTPELGAGGYSTAAFLRYKLPEVVYTATVEPVATALDLAVSNALWSNGHARAIIDDLAAEIIEVIKHMPETRSSKRLSNFVNSGELKRKVDRRSFQLADKEGRSRSASPKVDKTYLKVGRIGARWGHKASPEDTGTEVYCLMARRAAVGLGTDIEFLNGYFVRRGKALGIACPMNEMIINMVRAKRKAGAARPYQQSYPGSLGRPSPIPYETPEGPFTPAAGKFRIQPDIGLEEALEEFEQQQGQQEKDDHQTNHEREGQHTFG